MEWSKSSQYNSFNSFKGLSYYQNYRQILDWMNGADYLPPPVECNLDPLAVCNLDCYFCIVQRYIKYNRGEIGEMVKLPTDYIKRLVKFLEEWGVRGLCISGGGEPSLHEGVWDIETKMDVAFVTNAVSLSPQLKESMMGMRWVALSVDASNEEDYEKIKGRPLFKQVIKNIYSLASMRRKSGSKVDLCYKFLLLPENQKTIFAACQVAKELGVQDFHVRPVDYERPDIKDAKKLTLNKELIEEQFEMCHEIETKDFHVYTVTHKFDPDFHVVHDFERCLASPLVIPVLTDGNAYLCVDHKMEEKYRLGSCYPEPEKILEWWGGERHREMVKAVNINGCSRCTWSQYQRQCASVENDSMCFSFP